MIIATGGYCNRKFRKSKTGADNSMPLMLNGESLKLFKKGNKMDRRLYSKFFAHSAIFVNCSDS